MDSSSATRRTLNTALLCSVLSFAFASAILGQTDGLNKVSDEEYRVYVSVINGMFVGKSIDEGRSNPSQLVILSDTVGNFAGNGDDTGPSLKARLSGLSDEAAADYIWRNKKRSTLSASFDMKYKYSLLSKKDEDEIFRGGPSGWPGFYKKFPGSAGYIGFSRVGFNKVGDQAVVYVDHGCGGLCGTGHYILLEKSGNNWKIKEKQMAWIS